MNNMAPGSWREVNRWKLLGNSREIWRLTWISLGLLIPAFILFIGFGWIRGGFADTNGLDWALGAFLGTAVSIVLHEIVHGIFMLLFGALPQFGFKADAGVFYASAPGAVFSRNRYIIMVLAPFFLITLMALWGISTWPGRVAIFWIFIGVLNFSGAAGDIWIARYLLQYPASVFVVDEADGMRIVEREG
ncbi:MAG: DUF3267 domain-containing protein [Chloroflexi bacterium]|nr:DUF3267 domain-containing protein [Chloroflexota bacterium]